MWSNSFTASHRFSADFLNCVAAAAAASIPKTRASPSIRLQFCEDIEHFPQVINQLFEVPSWKAALQYLSIRWRSLHSLRYRLDVRSWRNTTTFGWRGDGARLESEIKLRNGRETRTGGKEVPLFLWENTTVLLFLFLPFVALLLFSSLRGSEANQWLGLIIVIIIINIIIIIIKLTAFREQFVSSTMTPVSDFPAATHSC